MDSNIQLLDSVRTGLSGVLGHLSDLKWIHNLPGGDINRAALIRSGNTNWFLKYHQHPPDGMFAAEAQALREIAEQQRVRVPSPVAHGSDGETAWLVLEHLELTASGSASLLGEQLAALHKVTFKEFGWPCNNYIGTTVQLNTYSSDWTEFWRNQRLQPQLAMANAAGFSLVKGEQLLVSLDQILDGHQPAPSLLHGDLWAGNKAFTTDGQPVIFDPASYYGDRETDIAMTMLFGGFDPVFYAAYEACFPLPDGYRLRRDLYNLYHVLNHLNLFGEAYLSRSENLICSLLAQVR